jgi:hypothetical protein
MKSCGFDGFHLSDLERTVRSHHDILRDLMPVMTLADAPPEAEMLTLNRAMLAERRTATLA